ncbi:DeoR/GlpR family DNA-binding transcription regulator [Salimicrobium halophilum]|uniref:Transcriptional regulator, DeoR family n=1 Tax=Salimicrobium halophilum TaxID=86666 RepID=A0A1G8V6P3_9BACI|nr:DeoR/GlpR family DNA-binding transcription regulator [Salimicrobium halophilum]SDJ61796.1 transcriptional regulator, DeoR family [Salimicrobium halophilum]
MLTAERHQLILSLLADKQTIRLQEIIDHTNASESTIRRDLDTLEKKGKLNRVHGGASAATLTKEEATMSEKSEKFHAEKEAIASFAARFIKGKETIFLDAGSTTNLMIPHLDPSITVVTNGPEHLPMLAERGITTYLIGGFVKPGTRAVIGANAVENLRQYRFDRCFVGVNGITEEDGLTTPDPEEAAIKKNVLAQSLSRYILADHSKFGTRTFTKFGDPEDAILITDASTPTAEKLKSKTEIEVAHP